MNRISSQSGNISMNESLNSQTKNKFISRQIKPTSIKLTKWKITKFEKIDKSLKDTRDKWIEFNEDTKSKLVEIKSFNKII